MIAAASAAVPAVAGADGVVVRFQGAERHLTPDEIAAAADRPAGTYLLRAEGTPADPVAHPPALSVRALVVLAGGSPDALSFLTIDRVDGTVTVLRREDLTDPAPFPDGPPIVWMDAGGVRFLRPLRDPSDANAADNIAVTGGDLAVRVHQGPLLVVRASADRSWVAAGRPVTLTAQVEGGPPGLTFAWRLGDGSERTGSLIRHRFAAPGVYEATVTVSGADDSGGSSDPLRIRVGDPPEARGDRGGGTGRRRLAPAQGPERERRAPGQAEARAVPAPAPPVEEKDAPEPAEAPAAGAPAPGPRAEPAPAALPAVRTRPRAPRRVRPAPAPPGTVVHGTLVAARAEATLPAADAAATALPAARRGTDPPRGVPELLAWLVAAAALVAAGCLRERRDLRPEATP